MAANIIIDPGKRNSARRKSRTLAVILGLLIASPGLAHADEPYWRQYRSIEDGFLIDAPALPRFESRVSSTPFGTVTQHNYGAFPGPEGVVFMVSVMQKNAADRRSDADILAFSARAVPRDA